MPFKVKPALQLKVYTDMVQAVILSPNRARNTWTRESLQELLHKLGHDFNDEEMARLNDELHARDIVEDVDV